MEAPARTTTRVASPRYSRSAAISRDSRPSAPCVSWPSSTKSRHSSHRSRWAAWCMRRRRATAATTFVSWYRSRCSASIPIGQAARAIDHSDFPVESLAAFEWVPGLGWSDQFSFWRQGYPAVMVTDTAFYRYPYYHTALDTPDKVCYAPMTRVVEGLR